jgi:hypothetical protein
MKFEKMPKRYLLAILEGALEVEAFCLLLFQWDMEAFWRLFLALSAHGLAIGLLALGFIDVYDLRNPKDRVLAVLGVAMTLPFPLLGFVAFSLLFVFIARKRRRARGIASDFERYIMFEPEQFWLRPKNVSSDERVSQEVDIAPFAQILESDDIAMKRGAILSVSRILRADAVRLLKRALSDPSREIRYYAQNALSEMESEFNDRIYKLGREIERQPLRLDLHLELARLVIRFIESGLLEEAMIPFFTQIGLRTLDKAIVIGSANPEVYLLMGKLKILGGDKQGALSALMEYWERNKQSAEAALLLAELLCETKQTDMARKVLTTAKEYLNDTRIGAVLDILGGASEG